MEEMAAKVFARSQGRGRKTADDLAAIDGVFFGRDAEFFILERAIRKRVAVIHGVGGTGKTELAKAFARWLQISNGLDDPRLVFFHSFEPGLPTFGLDLIVNEIMARFGNAQAYLEAGTTRERAELALKLFRQARCLLIWDNFETVASMPEPGQATPPLDEAKKAELLWFIGELRKSKSALLITSRSEEAWLGGPESIVRCEVGGLAERDALQYADHLLAPHAQASANRAAEPKSFKELIDYLGGHPLSLKLILPRLSEMLPSALLAGLKGQGPLPPALRRRRGGSNRSARASITPSGICPKRTRSASSSSLCSRKWSRPTFLALWKTPRRASRVSTRRLGRASRPAFGSRASHRAWRRPLPASSCSAALSQRALAGAGRGSCRRTRGGLAEPHRRRRFIRRLSVQANQRGTSRDGAGANRRLAGKLWCLPRRRPGRKLFSKAQALIQALNQYWDVAGLASEAAAWGDRTVKATEPDPGQAPEIETPAHDLWLLVMGTEAIRRAMKAAISLKAEAHHRRICTQAFEGRNSDKAKAKALPRRSYHHLGMVAQDRGRLDEAESWYQESPSPSEALGDKPADCRKLPRARHVASSIATVSTRPRAGIRNLSPSQRRWATSQHGPQATTNSASWRRIAAGWTRPRAGIRNPSPSSRRFGDQPLMAASHHQLGMVAQVRGRLDEAEGWYKKSLAI